VDRALLITAVDPDPRRPDAVRVEIDGARFGAVPRELASAEGLAVGRVVDPALQERLAGAADAEAAYRTVLRALEVRSYARGDLARRMLRKGHQRRAVEAALERAAGLGLLDDAAFAQGYVQTRSARGRGPSRLVRDLLSMGVDRDLIDRAIATEWSDKHDKTEMPLALAKKRAAQLGGLPRQTQRRRVVAYLARRLFSGMDITDIFDKVV
jgi:SOS response regulatory protein OraA/RecX